MRSTKNIAIILAGVVYGLVSCKNLEDVKPKSADTFIHFYGGPANFVAKAAEEIENGFIIVGDSVGVDGYSIMVIKTDEFGNTLWRKNISGGTSSALMITENGYLVIGDSIQVDLLQEQINDQVKRKMRLLQLDKDGNILTDKNQGTFKLNLPRVDYRGYAITEDKVNKYLISTGSIKFQGEKAKALITAYNPSTFDTLWSKNYDLDNRDYINAKSAHITVTGEIIWATSATQELNSSSKSYLAIPVLKPNSTFDNNFVFGRNEDVYYSGSDIQPSSTGYGIIGTYKSVTGANANVFFLRTDQIGNIISGSERFFDGEDLLNSNNSLADKAISFSEDEGSAIITTSDGGYLLAGSLVTTVGRGSGGKDILLIKLNAFGDVVWNKIIGGTGDETVSTVRVTKDSGFLISGTLNIAGLSSMFILKTDSKGNLEKN
jgi:hypothetical protein